MQLSGALPVCISYSAIPCNPLSLCYYIYIFILYESITMGETVLLGYICM